MKKLLLLASAMFLLTLNLSAQCTPDPQFTSSGVYPDSATNFLPACLGEPYVQLITNVVPADTFVLILGNPFPINIDSINVISVTGLPAGLTFACNNGDCAFLGGTTGCAQITGTPTVEGVFVVTIELKAYVGGGGEATAQAFTLDYYKIVVTDCNTTVGLNDMNSSTFKMFPNPANDKVSIQGLENKSIDQITLTDASGKTVQTYEVNGNQIEINTAELNVGLYFVNIYNANGMDTLKLVIE